MPVSVFQNRFNEPVTFVLEPNEEQYHLVPLATIGVRYSFAPEQVDRTFADVGRDSIRFWCDSAHREVEIVEPNAFDLLLHDICVNGGFCGGLVKDHPVHVTDLLPTNGIVTAEEFAALVLQAEGDEEYSHSPGQAERWPAILQAKFVEYMGHASVSAETLVQNLAQPFEPGAR